MFVVVSYTVFCGSIDSPRCAAMADSEMKGESGGVEGPDAMYVKLIASDGHEFFIKREHALTSGTIKAMLSGPGGCVRGEEVYNSDGVCVCVCVGGGGCVKG